MGYGLRNLIDRPLHWLAVLTVLAAYCLAGPPCAQADPDQASTNRIVIKLRGESHAATRAKLWRRGQSRHGKTQRQSRLIDTTNVDGDLAAVLRPFGTAKIRALHDIDPRKEAIAARYGLDRTFVIDLPKDVNADDVATQVAALDAVVESAEVDAWGEVAQLIPNDPLFCDQYAMHHTGMNCVGTTFGVVDSDVDAPEAWAIYTGNATPVTIAIIDSGVDPHPEYTSRMVPGWNTVLDNSNTADECRHGTHVAGIAAAEGNNGEGIAGMDWGANIMPVKVFNSPNACGGFASDVAEGIRWAVDHGADICNISLQFSQGTSAFESAVDYAYDNGVMVISASGNSASPSISFPARYTHSMAVGATDFSDIRPNFSNYGPELDVVAPGWQIVSTWTNDLCVGGTNDGELCSSDIQCLGVCEGGANDGETCVYDYQCDGLCTGGSNDGVPCTSSTQCTGGGICDTVVCSSGTCSGTQSTYKTESGTSMATPVVSGIAALIKSYNSTLTIDDIRRIITCTAEDKGTPGWDRYYGYGRVNAYYALLAAAGETPWMCGPDLPNGSIDARQPRDSADTTDQGWISFDLEFYGDTSTLTAADFTVLVNNAVDPTLFPLAVTNSPTAGYKRVILNRPISPGTWVTLYHNDSETPAWWGSLPGDANGNAAVEVADMQTLFNALNGVGSTPPIWSIDIDRSGQVTPADVLRLIDIFQGAAPYDVYLGTSLP